MNWKRGNFGGELNRQRDRTPLATGESLLAFIGFQGILFVIELVV